MITKEEADRIFDEKAFLVKESNVIPLQDAIYLTSEDAVDFARRMKEAEFNGYGIGEHTLFYLTRRGFYYAVTYKNVREYQKLHTQGKKTTRKKLTSSEGQLEVTA